ncbi:response regulator, partial [Planktothrix sp.]|uniref:response regulator n=1 Tax=Planktothrix sp. TaxID=3088171 RepID=UPI0038D48B3C
LDGLEMTRQLRADAEFSNLKIIASSPSVFSSDQEQCLKAGCNGFIPKPIQEQNLLNQVQDLLKLIWIYETIDSVAVTPTLSHSRDSLIIPPAEELMNLYDLARAGYILEVQSEANRIKNLDSQYVAFADYILQLSEAFKDEEIIRFIQPHLN